MRNDYGKSMDLLVEILASEAARLDDLTLTQLREIHPDSVNGSIVKCGRAECVYNILAQVGIEFVKDISNKIEMEE